VRNVGTSMSPRTHLIGQQKLKGLVTPEVWKDGSREQYV
jgi:hypothetical protein